MMLSNFVLFGLSLMTTPGVVADDTSSGDGDVAGSPNFHMALDLPGTKLHRRSTAYINDQGYITTDQSQATVFYISDDQLFSNGQVVSADPTDPYIIFAASSSIKSISTTWTRNGNLQWYNESFAGDGVARYCQGSNSAVYIVLQSEPSQCEPAVASPIPTASTTSSATSSATTGPPTPSVEGIAYYGYTDGEPTPSVYNGNSNVDIAGTADDINFSTGDTTETTFPGQSGPTQIGYYSVVYQGYFLAPVTSSFILTTTSDTDDFAFIWTGAKAFSAWADDNFDGESSYHTHDGSVTFDLNQGDTLPITILYCNTGGLGALVFTIFTQESEIIESSTAGYFLLPVDGDGFSNSGFGPT